jgi:2-methylcitrate dehydratase
VTMPSGEVYESVCRYPPGHPENPMSDADIEAKFRRLSIGILSDTQADRAIDAIWRLETCEELGAFMALFTV